MREYNIKKWYDRIRLSISPQNGQKNNTVTKDVKRYRAQYKARPRIPRVTGFEISDLTTAQITAINIHRKDRTRLLDIYEYVMKDGHLRSQIRTAKMKVTGRSYGLYRKGKRDDELSKMIEKKWFVGLMKHILDAEFWGFSAVELIVEDGKVSSVDLIPRQNISPDYKWILVDGMIDGKIIEIEGNEEITNVLLFAEDDNLGELFYAAFYSIYKFYDRGDWSRYNEKVGIPVLKMIIDSNLDEELDNAEARASSFGSDGYIVGQKGDEIDLIEKQNSNGHLSFKDAIQFDDDENSKIINGQTATSEEKSFVGSSEVQERILQDYSYTRMQDMKFNINDQVLPFLRKKGMAIPEDVEFNFAILQYIEDNPSVENTQAAAKEKTQLSRKTKQPSRNPGDLKATEDTKLF